MMSDILIINNQNYEASSITLLQTKLQIMTKNIKMVDFQYKKLLFPITISLYLKIYSFINHSYFALSATIAYLDMQGMINKKLNNLTNDEFLTLQMAKLFLIKSDSLVLNNLPNIDTDHKLCTMILSKAKSKGSVILINSNMENILPDDPEIKFFKQEI